MRGRGRSREEVFPGEHLESRSTHGTGCAFATRYGLSVGARKTRCRRPSGRRRTMFGRRSWPHTPWERESGQSITGCEVAVRYSPFAHTLPAIRTCTRDRNQDCRLRLRISLRKEGRTRIAYLAKSEERKANSALYCGGGCSAARLLGCRRLLVIGQWHQQSARRICHLRRRLRLRLGRSVYRRLLLWLSTRLAYVRPSAADCREAAAGIGRC